MEIEGTTFGTITIDAKTYEHDVIIRLSGEKASDKIRTGRFQADGTILIRTRDLNP
jgi:hypothetical protein